MACLFINGKKQIGSVIVSFTDDVTNERYFLLGKKKDHNGNAYYVAPGGEIETSDRSLMEGALRELKEETGFDFRRLQKEHPQLQIVSLSPKAWPNRDVHYFYVELGRLDKKQIQWVKTLAQTIDQHDLGEVGFAPEAQCGTVREGKRYPVQKDNLQYMRESPVPVCCLLNDALLPEVHHVPVPSPPQQQPDQSRFFSQPVRHGHIVPNTNPPLPQVGPRLLGNTLLMVSGGALIIAGIIVASVLPALAATCLALGSVFAGCAAYRFFSQRTDHPIPSTHASMGFASGRH